MGESFDTTGLIRFFKRVQKHLRLAKQFHSSTAIKRQGDAPPCLINRGRMIIFTRGFEILSQSTSHLQPAMDFLINAP